MTAQDPQRIAIGGRELEFVQSAAARPGLPTLVFLHEGLGSLALWRGVPEAIAARTGCGAFVYSRYGNGFSTPLAEARDPRYMHDEALSTLPALLDAVEIDDAILIGQSDGGSIALIFAAEHPGIARGLVLEAPHVFVETLSVESIAAVKAQYERGELRGRMARHHADADRTFYGWNDVWLAPEFAGWNARDAVRRLTVPTLALQGLDDEYGTPAQLEAIAGDAPAPVDRALFSRCGHAPHRERRTLFEGVVSAWIAELLAR